MMWIENSKWKDNPEKGLGWLKGGLAGYFLLWVVGSGIYDYLYIGTEAMDGIKSILFVVGIIVKKMFSPMWKK